MRISDWSSDVCSSDLLFRHHLVATLAGTFAVVACFAIFYLATSFALAHGTTALGYPKEQFLLIQLGARSEEHPSELQSLMRISYAVFCMKTNKPAARHDNITTKLQPTRHARHHLSYNY